MKKKLLFLTGLIISSAAFIFLFFQDVQAATVTLRPTGDGTYKEWQYGYYNTGYTNSIHWDKVDEVTADDPVTRVAEVRDDQTSRDSYTTANHTSETGTINSVTVYSRGLVYPPGTGSWWTESIRTYSSDYLGSAHSYSDALWHTTSKVWSNNPFTGAPWTWTEVDDLEIGVKCFTNYDDYAEMTYDIGVTQVYAMVDYTLPPPTVTTQAATSILTTSATGNGNISSTGGANATERGFKYGLTQTDTWSASDSGSFGTGAFTKTITGLSPNTLYYMRAFAVNSAGTSYGSYVSFTTASPPPPCQSHNVSGWAWSNMYSPAAFEMDEQTMASGGTLLSAGGTTREGARKTISNKIVNKLSFLFSKYDSPTGNVTFAIRKVSDGSVIVSKVWGDASALPTWPAGSWEQVIFDTQPLINEEVYVAVEFSGTGGNVWTADKSSDVKVNEYLVRYNNGWQNITGMDAVYEIEFLLSSRQDETIGWVSFSCANTMWIGTGADYGVDISTSTGNFSGSAWSENIGWISFDRSGAGSPPYSQVGVNPIYGPIPPCDQYGDVDDDGYVTFNDTQWIADYVSGSRSFNNEQKRRADVANNIGTIDQYDYKRVYSYVWGQVSTFSAVCGTATVPLAKLDLDDNKIYGWARALNYGGGWNGWIKLRGPLEAKEISIPPYPYPPSEILHYNSNYNSGWFYIAQTIPEDGIAFWVAAVRSLSTNPTDISAQLLYGITNTNTGAYYPRFLDGGSLTEDSNQVNLSYSKDGEEKLRFRQTGVGLDQFELKVNLPWGAAGSFQMTKTISLSKPIIYESGDGVIPIGGGIESLYVSLPLDQGFWVDFQKFNGAKALANHRWGNFILDKAVGSLPAGTVGVYWEILDANNQRQPEGYTNFDLLIPGNPQKTIGTFGIKELEYWNGHKKYLKKWQITQTDLGVDLVFETLIPNQENSVLGTYYYEGMVKVLNPSTGIQVGTGMLEQTHDESSESQTQTPEEGYGVSINTTNGEFSGWAWSDMVIGWISFQGIATNGSIYKVKTTLPFVPPNQPPDKPDVPDPYKPSGVTWDNCIFLGKSIPTFHWTPYVDPDDIPPGTDPQTAYEIEVDNSASFSGEKFNHLVNGVATSYALDLTQDDDQDWLPEINEGLDWQTSYHWRVRVKDSNGNWSDWSNPREFQTPNEAYPYSGFTWVPQNPNQGEVVIFTPDDPDLEYLWTITEGAEKASYVDGPTHGPTSAEPHIIFGSRVNKIKLKVTSGSYSCTSAEYEISAKLPLPEYKEVPPLIWLQKALAALVDFFHTF